MMTNSIPSPSVNDQIPLVVTVYEDDTILYNSPNSPWYPRLRDFDPDSVLELGAQYYNCLYDFNKRRGNETEDDSVQNTESKEEAQQRLLNDRPTVDKSKPVLYEPPEPQEVETIVTPAMIGPGITPNHGAGKKPKCFFALFKGFIGVILMGLSPDPENVLFQLESNPQFARVCGFIPHNGEDPTYNYNHIPGIRKLQQFDQIMTEYGLWEKCKQTEVIRNLISGTIEEENTLVGDTTHYHAYSSFETVPYTDEKGKEATKSQSKVTKNCHCDDWNACPHEWVLADDGAGTVVKAHQQMHWAHKASILGLPLQGIPLDAAAVADAATHDGQTFLPHVEKVFETYPILPEWIDIVLYDSACDDSGLKDQFKDELGVTLKASLNPRGRKPILDLPQKCMDSLSPYGTLVCTGGLEMDFKGARHDDEQFIYGAPLNDDGLNACASCPHKPACCPNAENGRTVQIPFSALPHIDPKDPPMSKRFKTKMKQRTSVERIIKRLKCDLGDDRLKRRGNQFFQAHLDKILIAFHILLRQ